jgi:hypothetical protein
LPTEEAVEDWIEKNYDNSKAIRGEKSYMPDKEELLDVENTLHKFHFGIELDEDIISYNMGETVKGSVILSLPKPLEFSEILLSLKGKEKSRYAKEITNRETGGKYTKQTDESY